MAEQKNGWWTKKLWILVLFPILAAVLMIPVGILQGWAQYWYGAPSGAPSKPRTPVTLVDGYRHIVTDLKRRDAATRPHMRYLTWWHRQNDPDCTDAQLDQERQAIHELLTMMTKGKIGPLEFIDPEQLILPINLETLDWDASVEWRKLVSRYRYALTGGAEEDLAELRRQVEQMTRDRVPVVRGDWFIVIEGKNQSGKLPESIEKVIQQYNTQMLTPAACARELGLKSEKPLLELITARENLQQEFGLAPLLRGESIRRSWWESDRHHFSPYQELSRLLKRGLPVRIQ